MHERQQEERRFPDRMKSNNPNNNTADGENLSCKWQASALIAIHEMAEHLLVMYFELLYIPSRQEYLYFSSKIALHAKRQTIMHRDSELLRDIVRTIDQDHPLGKMSSVTETSKITQWLELRHKQSRTNRRFEKTRLEKLALGLHPHWNTSRHFIGWRNTPMEHEPKKKMPWWEDKLQSTDYKANPWPEAALTF
jgi:histone H3/H4